MKTENRLTLSLLAMRVTVALVMLVWNLDKFINPQHAIKVYESFYLLGGLGSAGLPANLLQAQRDYFGAHIYERIDRTRGEFFHADWTGHGGKVSSTTYGV